MCLTQALPSMCPLSTRKCGQQYQNAAISRAVSGTADEDHGRLEQGGHMVDSGGAQIRGEAAETKVLLVLLVSEAQSRVP